MVTNSELIKLAESVINSKKLKDFYIGDVAAAAVSQSGKAYTGVCIGGYLGICAEQSAIAAMVTSGETRIQKIVAVWKDEKGTTYVLPPCGRCREFMRQIDQANKDTEVVLGLEDGESRTLQELVPHYDTFGHPLDKR